jgi:hypothetical protein
MLKRLLLLIFIVIFVNQSDAQNMRRILKKRTAEVGIWGGVGYYGNPHWAVGTTIHYLHGVGRKKQWFAFGCGLRAVVFNTKRRDYQTSSNALYQLNIGGADSLYMPEVQTNTINAYFTIKIHIKRGVDAIFTTDLGGINFGDSKTGYFHSYETDPVPPGVKYKTEPYAFNLNQLSYGSVGSLMHEAYGSFKLNDVLLWRLGFQYFRNEYKVDRYIPLNGKRFYQNHWMAMTALAFDIRWKKNKDQARYF